MKPADQLDSFFAISRFADNLDIWLPADNGFDAFAKDGVIVANEYFDPLWHRATFPFPLVMEDRPECGFLAAWSILFPEIEWKSALLSRRRVLALRSDPQTAPETSRRHQIRFHHP